jgi:hypothetical protein
METDTYRHLADTMHRDVYTQKIAIARAEYNAASIRIDLESARERCYEVRTAAFQYTAKGELFKQHGELTDRERAIAKSVARYVAFGRTD